MIPRTEELKRCPFCGEKPTFSECANYITVHCSCSAKIENIYGYDYEARKQKAIDIWNRRPFIVDYQDTVLDQEQRINQDYGTIIKDLRELIAKYDIEMIIPKVSYENFNS